MKIAIIIARILLGAVFLVFGLNGFLNFLEAPQMTGDAGTFVTILHTSGYLVVIKVLEILGGAILLSGKCTPLGLLLLGPVIVNILLFHIFLAPEGLPMAIVLVLLEAFLIWANRLRIAPLLKS